MRQVSGMQHGYNGHIECLITGVRINSSNVPTVVVKPDTNLLSVKRSLETGGVCSSELRNCWGVDGTSRGYV